jgi:hypothetical protein
VRQGNLLQLPDDPQTSVGGRALGRRAGLTGWAMSGTELDAFNPEGAHGFDQSLFRRQATTRTPVVQTKAAARPAPRAARPAEAPAAEVSTGEPPVPHRHAASDGGLSSGPGGLPALNAGRGRARSGGPAAAHGGQSVQAGGPPPAGGRGERLVAVPLADAGQRRVSLDAGPGPLHRVSVGAGPPAGPTGRTTHLMRNSTLFRSRYAIASALLQDDVDSLEQGGSPVRPAPADGPLRGKRCTIL